MKEEYLLNVNGYDITAAYDSEDVEDVFLPLLEKISSIHEEKQRRIFVFLAAPPGTGKTTLTLFLEKLAAERGYGNIQAVGMDGFHYYQEYLDSYYVTINGESVLLASIKGSSYTFDTERLHNKLSEASQGHCRWPLYDRNIHDPREDVVEITGDIILLEGNYLLLNDERWAVIREFCDYSIFIRCNPSLLEERLIARKARGNVTLEEAKKWYQRVDGRNVDTVLSQSIDGDCVLVYDGERYSFQSF